MTVDRTAERACGSHWAEVCDCARLGHPSSRLGAPRIMFCNWCDCDLAGASAATCVLSSALKDLRQKDPERLDGVWERMGNDFGTTDVL